MRTYFTKLTAIVFASATLFATACSSDDTTTAPNFKDQPNPSTSLSAGDVATFQITPNTKWTLTLSNPGANFWFDDAGQKTYSMRGAAGEYTIRACTSDTEQFDETYTCDVILSMDDKQQTLGTLTLNPTARIFALYVSQADAADFSLGSDPLGDTYLYESAAVDANSAVSLIWPTKQNRYSRPIKVLTNFNWQLTGFPEWLTPADVQDPISGSGNSGVANEPKELILIGDDSKYPANGETGTLTFVDKANSDATFEVAVTLNYSADARRFEVYSCGIDDGYDFYFGEGDMSYQYDTTPVGAEGITLAWPSNLGGYSRPILVSANVDWTLTSCPTWLKSVDTKNPTSTTTNNNGEANVDKEIRLVGDATKYPLDGATANLIFTDNNNENATFTIPVTIPACKDYISITNLVSALSFTAEGTTSALGGMESSEVRGSIASTNGSVIYILAKSGKYYYSGADYIKWIKFTEAAWDSSDASVIQSRRISISVEENEGEERVAKFIALPKSMAAEVTDPDYDLCNPDGTDIADKYQPYVFTTLTQEGVTGGAKPLTVLNSWAESYFNPKTLTSGDDYDLYAEYGVPVYELTYKMMDVGQYSMLSCNAYAAYYAQNFSDTNMASWISVEQDPDDSSIFNLFMTPEEGKEAEVLKGVVFFYSDAMMMNLSHIIICNYAPEF